MEKGFIFINGSALKNEILFQVIYAYLDVQFLGALPFFVYKIDLFHSLMKNKLRRGY